MTILSVLLIVANVYVGRINSELICPAGLDPVCEKEMDKWATSHTNPLALGEFVLKLAEFGTNIDVLTAMVPHIIGGIVGGSGSNCDSNMALKAPIDIDLDADDLNSKLSGYGYSSLNQNTEKVVNKNMYLSPYDIRKYVQMTGDIVDALNKNAFYNQNLLQTLKNMHDYLITDYKKIGFQDDMAVAITFNLGACVDILEISVCASVGYGMGISNNAVQYYVTAGGGGSIGIGPDTIPFGLTYDVSFDFMQMGNIPGLASSVGVDASNNANSLNYFGTGNIMPSGISFYMVYNGLVPFIDCFGPGFSLTALDTSLGVGVGVNIGAAYTEILAFDCVETFTGNGANYRGCQSKTKSNADCQKWSEQSPATHSFKPENYLSAGIGEHNYCRNPDGSSTMWCYNKNNGLKEDCLPLASTATSPGSDITANVAGRCTFDIFKNFLNSKKLGDDCIIDQECIGSGIIGGKVGCCAGTCKQRPSAFVPLLGKTIAFGCPAVADGGKCCSNTDCASFKLLDTESGKCCDGKCTPFSDFKKDYLGISFCADECKAGPGCKPGTCDTMKTKKQGEICSCHGECEGSGLGVNDMACCQGTCQRKQKDYLGMGWCPNECRAALNCPTGSCSSSKAIGATCSCHEECSGYGLGTTDTACCGGTCQRKQKDYLGAGWCPNECRAALNCPTGSCSSNKPIGGSCSCHEECSGYGTGATDTACCSGTCQRKQKDYLGAGWCPNECKAGPFCPAGSCSSSKPIGSSCSCDGECSGTDAACCSGTCQTKVADYLGAKWCPNVCKAGPFCGGGTCPKGGKSAGQSCSCHSQCSGSGLGLSDMACCSGVCKRKENGVCTKPIGGSCTIGTQCEGYTLLGTIECCSDTCTQKVKQCSWIFCSYPCP